MLGVDLYVPLDFPATTLQPGESVKIPAGIKVEVPAGYAMIFFNKSGVAAKRSLIVGACVIDHGYAGEVHINLINAGTQEQTISPGEKIVQAVVIPVLTPEFIEVPEDNLYQDILNASIRGDGGFGSTGTK
jgi:dUTP pyrophosphatase